MSAAQQMNLQQNVITPWGPVPAWYAGHSEEVLDREVHHEGNPLGFKVRDVLPARRWAIDPHGDTLSQHEFEAKYKDWYFLQLAIEAQGKPITEDRSIIPVPRVDRFIDKEPDHDGRLKRIGQDERPNEFRARQRYAHTGQTMEDYEREKAAENSKREKERERDSQARQLMQLHKDGVLDAETFAKQMESLYGVPNLQTEKSEAKAEAPAPAPAEETPAAPNPEGIKTRCGKEVKKSPHLHEMHCKECKRLKAEEEAPEAT